MDSKANFQSLQALEKEGYNERIVVFRVFWALTVVFVVAIILVGGMRVWATVSCATGNETVCLHRNFATYTVEGMSADQMQRRQQDYDAYPMADRNNVMRRWFLLRTERIGGAVYATRQACFGVIWPKAGTLGGLDAFQQQCFDRQIVSSGPRYGDPVPPPVGYRDQRDYGQGLSRSYDEGGTVRMRDLQDKWNQAAGMFDVSPAGEMPTI